MIHSHCHRNYHRELTCEDGKASIKLFPLIGLYWNLRLDFVKYLTHRHGQWIYPGSKPLVGGRSNQARSGPDLSVLPNNYYPHHVKKYPHMFVL